MTDAPRCTATAKGTGEQCKRPPAVGATVCVKHGAAAPQVRAAAQRRLTEQRAEKLVATYGLPVDVSPIEALLEEIRWTAGHVAWLRERVRELEEEALVWGTTKVKEGGDDRGTTEAAAPSVWLDLYQRERTHLVKVCSEAIRAGIEERRVKLAEQQGELVAQAIRAILEDLQLTPEQAARVPEVVPRRLRLLAGGAA